MYQILKNLIKENTLKYIIRINSNKSLAHLYYKIPQFKKFLFSKKFILIRSKIVSENRIWRFYIKFLGVYIFFFPSLIFQIKILIDQTIITKSKSYENQESIFIQAINIKL